MKDDLMTDKQKELASKYSEFYLKAYRDKEDRGIPDMIELCDKYWEGGREPESDTDPCSNVNIVHSNVEGQVAMLLEQNIAITPLPQTPADQPFAEQVRLVLEFIKDKNNMVRKLDMHERRREKYGTGILRVTYDPDALGGAGIPLIECVPNHSIYVDPCITDVYRLNEAEFIIETTVKSLYWAKQQYGEDIADNIQPNYFPENSGDVFKEQKTGSYGDSQKYLHMLVWTLKDGNLRLVEMTGCGLILSDSEEKEDSFYATGKYPYFFTPLYRREASLWGKGDVELIIPLQDLINDLDDQIRINARLTGNPQRLIETGSGIDLDALTNEAGLNIPVNNINSVRNLEAPPLPSYIENRRNQALQYEIQKVTRFSDQMSGNKQSGVSTATEALALQQAGSVGIQQKKVLLQETLSEVFSYCLELVREFWTSEVAVRVTDEDDEFIFFKGDSIRNIPSVKSVDSRYRKKFKASNPNNNEPTYMLDGNNKSAEFDIKVTVGAGMPTNKAFVYNMMMELTKGGLITPQEMRKWLVENFGLPITPDMPQEEVPQNVPQNIQPIPNSPDIAGINQAGNVMGVAR